MMKVSRRAFMNLSTALGAGLLANPLETFASRLDGVSAQSGFKLMVMATNWGFAGGWGAFTDRIREDGYDGAELWYPHDASERNEILKLFEEKGLHLGVLIGSQEKDYQTHVKQFSESLEGAIALNPVYINCHSGRDFFSFEQNKTFIRLTAEASASSGVPVYHETHRSRILFASSVARTYFEQFPKLKITLDISHWCNVSESLLADQEETVALALDRTEHIHARIGHPEGPQVNDPRAPEWKKAVEAHFGWWDGVVRRKKTERRLLTILTEFGPQDYMPTLPYTRKPVADQWEINKYMLDTLRKRYA
jgi:sugar phosphate isomerase/epimerase